MSDPPRVAQLILAQEAEKHLQVQNIVPRVCFNVDVVVRLDF